MKRAIDSVNERILAAVQRRPPTLATSSQPRLVAVSKLKPVSDIIEAYSCGQRYFGENYIQELEEKSNSKEIIEKCPDIKFHFIGHLQSNKVNKLLKVRNLEIVETVDSIKLANMIDKAISRHQAGFSSSGDEQSQQGSVAEPTLNNQTMKVMIQVNTSGEDQKNGIQPSEATNLAKHILNQCHNLELAGLMTIGKLEGWNEPGPNKDFLKLYETRGEVAKNLNISPQNLELSMGMSSDFEEAITLGSTSVRVGTLIFGERKPK